MEQLAFGPETMKRLTAAVEAFKSSLIKAWNRIKTWIAAFARCLQQYMSHVDWRMHQSLWMMQHPGHRRYRSRRRRWLEGSVSMA